MKHPAKAQVQTVITNFESVLPLAIQKGHLNMNEFRVRTTDHECGTIHCHGGWYAVAIINHAENRYIGFETGSHQIAIDLGLGNDIALVHWARENPKLWGNRYGINLFSEAKAFNPGRKRKAHNLQDIINHWKEVKERLPG